MLKSGSWGGGGGRGTLSVTDLEVPPKSLRLQAVPEVLLKMYARFRNFFIHFRGLLDVVYIGNVANVKNTRLCIIWSISNVS